MRSRNHWRKESFSTFVAGVSAAELPHLLGLKATPGGSFTTLEWVRSPKTNTTGGANSSRLHEHSLREYGTGVNKNLL
jgi:hypothetical protein